MPDSAKILVVDDTPANLEVITETLSFAGYAVSTAISGERALKRLQTCIPDLILLDVQMPGMDGFETCQQLKADPATAHIPVIFMTALVAKDSKVKGLALGAVDYITKPFQEAELLARVNTHLQLSFLTQQLERRVQERTAELQLTLDQLSRSLLERQQAEAALIESEAYHRTLFDQAAIGLALCSMSGQILYCNPAHAKILGRTTDELPTLTYWEITPESYAEQEQLQLQSLQTTGRYGPYEKEYIHKDGHLIPVRLSGITVERNGEQCIWSSVENISDRKAYEERLEKTNAELIRATRMKDEFLATMSHELRTPMNAILGMTEALQDEIFGTINEKQLKALHTVERSGNHLLELINDILDVSKIASGQIELDYQNTAITPLCQQSLDFVKPQAAKKSIQTKITLPVELPNLNLDERRIRQVLVNLLGNAVKFTPEGGCITLEVICPITIKQQSYLQINVKDTGIGIAPENLQKVFEPFIQVDSALNRKYEGTGLGLALVKRIVELHQGEVTLTSELGVGSCFAMALPLQ